MNRAEAKGKVMVILSRHVGIEKAIGMGELYSAITGESWRNRINDTRALRTIVTELRYEGALIGETRSRNGGGYYLARSAHELGNFFGKRRREALKKLYMISRMQKISLGELLGQMQLSLRSQEPGDRRRETGEQKGLFDGSGG
jgi:hypothetical protein